MGLMPDVMEHIAVNDDNIQDLLDGYRKEADAHPQDQRLRDKALAFAAFHTHSYPSTPLAKGLTQLDPLTEEDTQNRRTMQRVEEVVRSVELAAAAKVVRAENEEAKDEDTAILLNKIYKKYPEKHNDRMDLLDQLQASYLKQKGPDSTPLRRTREFQKSLQECLEDAHVQPELAQDFAKAIVEQNAVLEAIPDDDELHSVKPFKMNLVTGAYHGPVNTTRGMRK